MRNPQIINKAIKFCIKKKYTKAIQTLEAKLGNHLDDPCFLALLSRLYLQTGDLENAELYGKRGLRYQNNNVDLLLIMAAIHCKHCEATNSLNIWLQVLENQRYNRYARRGLKLLRQHSRPAELAELVKSQTFWRLLPPFPGLQNYRRRRLLWLVAALSVIAVALMLLYSQRQLIRQRFFPEQRAGSEIFLPALVKNSRQIDQIAINDSFARLQKYYESYQDNAARYEINLLKRQQLSTELSKRLLLIEPLLIAPEMHSLKNNFSFPQVAQSPALYDKCYVIWQGRVTNIVKTTESVGFDLLVDYIDGLNLSGTVTVWFDGAVNVAANQAIELFAQVIFQQTHFYLQGKTIRKLS